MCPHTFWWDNIRFTFDLISIYGSYVDVFPNVSLSLHPLSLCVTCHLSLHPPQPNISITDLSDHVSVFPCPSAIALCIEYSSLSMSYNILSSDALLKYFCIFTVKKKKKKETNFWKTFSVSFKISSLFIFNLNMIKSFLTYFDSKLKYWDHFVFDNTM